MDNMLADILDNARRIRSEKGDLMPVGIIDLDGHDTGIVGLNLNTQADTIASMVALGTVARLKGCQRAFVVQDVAMVVMSREEAKFKPHPPSFEDLPLDDRRQAIFVAELWFNEPARNRSILQEYRFLGLPRPVFQDVEVNSAWTPNGACSHVVEAYHGRLKLPGLEITEQQFGRPGMPDTIDIREILEELDNEDPASP